MQFRSSAHAAILLAVAGLTGCSGGGGSDVGSANVSCSGATSRILCLHNCNLGCNSVGCLRTDIAQNENIILQFSSEIDPASVSTSTIQFRTASGELPVGQFFVNGSQVEFVPTLLVSGGQTFFGFSPGETYTMTLPGLRDTATTVRDTAGRPLRDTFTCTLIANQGIKDHNGVPPSATLVSPSAAQVGSAPLSTVIVLEFNEMVDATPFLAATGGGSGPVTFSLRRTRPAGSARECDSSSLPVVLTGTARLDYDPARGISVLTFHPNGDLPANTCIEINVTSTVVDLSGKPAQPQVFSFLTEQVPLAEDSLTEEFDNDNHLDHDVSGGSWAGGVASFLNIGGDGRHGVFDVSLGQSLGTINGKRTFVINTDNTVIPGSSTRTGDAIAVTDGKFFFSKMVVPADVRLRFVGTHPPVFTVAGKLDVQGEIDIKGESLTTLPTNAILVGQAGGAAGIFGGAGGQGGDRCAGTGYFSNYDGRPGVSGSIVGGRAYATSTATAGGRGSHCFPLSGNSIDLLFGATSGIYYTPSAAAGGGGGGLMTDGTQGRVVSNNWVDPVLLVPPRLDAMGPAAAGGTAVQFFPFPAASGSTKSSVHFLVGGAGGGGAGSQATLCIAAVNPRIWSPGGGGGGGGGAIALRAGDSLSLGALGRIFANGGGAANSSGTSTVSSPAPGGGGSGGSVVLQSGRLVDISGIVDVRGGAGGVYNRSSTPSTPTQGAIVQISGGNGAAGFVRCEVPGTPTPALIANALPAPTADNVGPLAETDDLGVSQSTWYSTGLPYGPEYARYEIYATVDGVPVLFSDDSTVSPTAATTGAPIRAYFQNANLDLATGQPAPLSGETQPTIRPWRNGVLTVGNQVGIASDGLNGFRFALVLDRTVSANVSIDKVKVVYRH